MSNFSENIFDHFRRDTRILRSYLIELAKNPIQAIKSTPRLEWISMVSFHGLIAAICGTLAGLIGLEIIKIISGLFLFPIAVVFFGFVTTSILYYSLIFFARSIVDFRALYTLVVFSSLPYLAFHTLTSRISPIDLIGFAFSSILLIVGLVDQFQLPRTRIIKMIGIVYLIFVLSWIIETIQSSRTKHNYQQLATPESLDVLQKEFN